MILVNDSLMYSNVISKRYIIEYKNFKMALNDFMREIKVLDAHPKAQFFYSVNDVNENGMMAVEIYMPVEEQFIEVNDKMYFHSYYIVKNMLSMNVTENYEQNTPLVYARINEILEENNLQQRTVIYNVPTRNDSNGYDLTVKVGFCERESARL